MSHRASLRPLTAVCGWILFLLGCFTLLDGTVALVTASPCWIVRLGIALTSFVLTSAVGLWTDQPGLRVLVTLSTWLVFAFGGVALAFGVYSRFTRFDYFKLWQWSLILGGIAMFLSAIIAFLSSRLDTPQER